jgi:uncharacterized protein YceK
MKRVTLLLFLTLLLSGCSSTAGTSTISPTNPPAAIPTATPAGSVQLGTGLSGSGQNVAIVDPKTSFIAQDTFAFVIHLAKPIGTTQLHGVITDPQGGKVFTCALSPGTYRLSVFANPRGYIDYANGTSFTYTP